MARRSSTEDNFYEDDAIVDFNDGYTVHQLLGGTCIDCGQTKSQILTSDSSYSSYDEDFAELKSYYPLSTMESYDGFSLD